LKGDGVLRKRKNQKVFGSLLVLMLLFTLLFPMGAAAAEEISAANQSLSREAIAQMKSIIAQEKADLSKGPSMHADLQNLSGDEEVSVIVGLSEAPVAFAKGVNKVEGKKFTKTDEKNVIDKVKKQQKKFEGDLNTKGVKAKFRQAYNYAFNGMSIKVKASQLKKLLTVDGVRFVEPDVEMKALGDPVPNDASKAAGATSDLPGDLTSGQHLNVPAVWSLGYQGQNVKVAVLDTGIDYYHPEFQGVYKGGYNFIDQSNPSDYARTRDVNDPYETTPLDRPANKAEIDSNGRAFYTEHGTHVAGIIAAQGNNPYGIKGLAPKVDLYSYRVLGAYGSGPNSGIIAAIDKAVQEKMDVINLSLGSTSNNSTSSDAIAINNAALAGVTAVVATGNSGPNRGTIGSPSTAAFAISVGNSTIPEKTMKGQVNIQLEGSSPTGYNLNLMGWKFGTDPSQILAGTYDVVSVPNFGVDADYNGLDVRGKVAFISRGGGVAFVDKIAAAKKAGAIATIIHNNGGTNGNGPTGVFLGDSFSFIPTFDMSYTDGTALRTALQTQKATVTFSDFATGTTAGDDINSSSSRGPSNPNFDLKPDVSAPGTDIMSSIPAYKKDFPNADYTEAYERLTGTSMATPQIAGVAALLKSEHPDWTPFDIKVAISNTAKQLDVTKYDVFSQGPGRVQPYEAATTEALAYAMDKVTFSNKTYDNIKGTITFGNVATGNATTITKDILVKNLTGNASDYTASVQVTKAATGALAGTTVTVDQPSFTLAGSDSKTLKVSLNVPTGAGTTGNEILGYVKLTNGKTNLILPFAANFAPPSGIKNFSIDSKYLSPNGDGKLDNTTIRYEFWNAQRQTYLELWDATNPTGGAYGDGYLGYLVSTTSTTTGPKTVAFNGSYTEWGTGKKVNARDGVYTLDLTTLNATNTAVATYGWIGPIYVKSTPSKINVEDQTTSNGTNLEFAGSLDDSFVNFGPTVKNVFGLDYDVNEHLHAKYVLTNSNGEAQEATPISLDQDGKFKLSVSGLTLGENKLKVIVDDEAQNHAEKEVTITRVDATKPVTNAALEGTAGNNGWYTSEVSVKLSAMDEESGVSKTQYKVNGGAWKDYTEPFKVSTDGIHKVEYRSIDKAGNIEDTHSMEIKIDKKAPVLKVKVDKPVLSPPNHKLENIKVTLDYSDATSGIDSVVLESITVNEANASPDDIQDASYGTMDTEFSLRSERNGYGNGRIYTITYLATDKAGNTIRATATVTVPKGMQGNN
jgi:subtilisin family serine protease